MTQPSPIELGRAAWFTFLLVLVNLVGDGWSGRPVGLPHQLLLLPFTALFLFALWKLLFGAGPRRWAPRRAFLLAIAFEIIAVALFAYEGRHFASFGYRVRTPIGILFLIALALLAATVLLVRRTPRRLLLVALAAYAGGVLLAIASFPLNYLRSDMLPVILWADTNLLHHVSPYATMHVGVRLYDFPYLPGMLVAYLPFLAAHLDIRFATIAFVSLTAALAFRATHPDRRLQVAALLTLFVLSPFLQYRHDLYLSPHWLTLMAAFVLMQRRRFAWAAFVFGLSMAIYQFSWILFPFFLLHAFRRRGWLEAFKLAVLSAAGALALVGPFLRTAMHHIAHNTVSQWSQLPHALADPINLSYWATYFIHPDHLLRLQAVLMVTIFLYCVARHRCATLADTLRWMSAALSLFILFNLLVDGYFYLMLLVVLLAYVCVANNWWSTPASPAAEA